ncbi:hypothetical protein J2S43_001871 [Catenuloplanes nepalensis]|uniref:Secreted protein n=1 Tax=Catenuloplanes nepalensis TaxID=587533 RepID=A0ABT9MPK1_9ACTN|nr:hypothetical protein [Catenuloplanes nepalensis]MDP9793359.1 hypothetical protein [Catenuloplanes nepalensis]
MRRAVVTIAVGGAAGVAAVAAARRMRQARVTDDRWHSITVNREREEVGPQPQPLHDLGETIQVRVRPAPGGRGTEIAARCVDAGPEGVRALRRALRETRTLVETGEILLPDSPPTTRRTPLGAPLAYATRHGRQEGRL